MIEDIWLETNEEKPVPLPGWYSARETRSIDWIKKEDAVSLHEEVKNKFGVDLCGLESTDLPDHTLSVVGRLEPGVDLAGLKSLLLSAPSEYQLSVRLGARWVMYDAVLNDDGGLVPK